MAITIKTPPAPTLGSFTTIFVDTNNNAAAAADFVTALATKAIVGTAKAADANGQVAVTYSTNDVRTALALIPAVEAAHGKPVT